MKRIAVINDLSGFGRCSLTAALPIISALGAECCPLPTAALSNQTGYDSYFCFDLTDSLDSFISEWKKLGCKFDAILTGFITSPKQAQIILKFIDEFKTDKTKLIVDPVMADDGKIYDSYSRELCENMAQIAKKANIITPNLSELCILAGTGYEETVKHKNGDGYIELISDIAAGLLSENLKAVTVTGVIYRGHIYNIIVEKEKVCTVKSEIYGGSFSGTGDIFSSIIAAEAANGKELVHSVELAAKFLEMSIKSSYLEKTDRNDGVNFQKFLEVLTNEQKQ